jgi:thioesterase domain-containing protein
MSSGGLIAFEMAHQIAERGGETGFLGLLDTSLPDPDAAARFTEESTLTAIAGELGCADLMPLPTLEAIVETGHASDRLPPGFTLEHAERIAAVFRNNVARHLEYGPRHWDGPLLLVRALRRSREGDVPPDWSHLCPGVKSVDLDCGHMEILSPAFAPALAALIALG